MDPITISTTINASREKVWEYWNNPAHITKWAFASDEWECPQAENDLRTGGRFKSLMAAKDKSASFDFTGVYTNIVPHEVIEYTMSDGRNVRITFEQFEDGTLVTETFDPEQENPLEMQRDGWLAILTNFKNYVEKSAS